MNRPVRSVNAYFEATGPYALERARAEQVYGKAIEEISRRTGPIALNGVQGVNIPLGDKPVTPDNVRLGKAPHSALITARPLVVEGNRILGNTRLIRRRIDGLVDKSVIKGSHIITGVPRQQSDDTLIGTVVHEFAHSLGQKHCPDVRCIMQASCDINLDTTIMAQDNPFCDDCTGDLELAGYQALAAQL
jgi:hypothetical protein